MVNSVHGKRKIELVGTVTVGKLKLNNVLYIPSSEKNIISLAKMLMVLVVIIGKVQIPRS